MKLNPVAKARYCDTLHKGHQSPFRSPLPTTQSGQFGYINKTETGWATNSPAIGLILAVRRDGSHTDFNGMGGG